MTLAPHVAICIATYKRHDGLRSLLESLAEVEWAGRVTIVVVDNDPVGMAGVNVCQDLDRAVNWPLIWLVESEPGIPFPRNAAIAAALENGADLLAFVDDDERPPPQWLNGLYSGIQQGAAVAGGPQVPVFPSSATAEQRQTTYYGHDQRMPSGTICQLESSGNFMIRSDVIAPLGPPWFDPKYARTSGADHDLFRRLELRGAQMRWIPEALVFEDIPEHRLSEAWLRERVVEIHNGRVRIDRQHDASLSARLVRLAKTAALGVQACLMTVVGLGVPSAAHRAKLLRWKFAGKSRAHLGAVVDRHEDRPHE